MKKALLLVLLLLGAAIAGLRWLNPSTDAKPGAARTPDLIVLCAAGLAKPVEKIAADFERETGIHVVVQKGGTGALLSNLRTAKENNAADQSGDLFISADSLAIADAQKFDGLREVIPLVKQHPVIAVRTGNPLKIHSVADLLRPEVRLALATPKSAAIGRVVQSTLGQAYAPLAAKMAVEKPTVPDLATDLSVGAVDAAILWDSTVPQFPNIETVEVPEFSSVQETASAAVTSLSRQPTAALRLARYLAAPEKGGATFQAHKFTPVGGDEWAFTPELILYSGGVNRPAVEALLKEFADREGVSMTTVFNGCGILCATMKAMDDSNEQGLPDAYYACDLCFIPPVANLFPQTLILTETEIGIVVKKGNPHGIKTVADLGKPGLKVGLCNMQQSTLGFMTNGILQSSGVNEAVRKNVVVEVPTADFLINQMRVGALDAAIVYKTNARLQEEHLDFLKIDHPGARAQQPFSVRADSPHRQLAYRLLDFFKAHRKNFEDTGFIWRGDEAPIESHKIQIPEWLKSPSQKVNEQPQPKP